jgi:hypothetical protein
MRDLFFNTGTLKEYSAGDKTNSNSNAALSQKLSRQYCYEPFWQTVSASPWNVNSPFTDVLSGAPK